MRNLKTVTALLVVFTMMLGTVAFAAFEDVKGTNVEESVTTLAALGIISGYEDGTFGPDRTITRAEFAAVVTRALGLGDSGAEKTPTKFSDVPEEHWASGYVSLASSMGIIVGHGDGTFGPDDEVTYEQAIKMLVCALGYEPAAVASGGYPTGYMVVASQERITRGATGTPGQPALRGVVAQLTYNALDVVLMIQTGFGRDPIYEKNPDGRTLLNDKLDVMKIYGKVTANEYSTLTSPTSSSRENEVTISYYDEYSTAAVDDDGYNAKIVANVGDTNAADYLGYKVIAYVREDNLGRDRTVVAIMEDKDEIDKLVIDAFNIENVDEQTSRIVLEYWIDKEKDYDPEIVYIETNPVVIYNGKAKTTKKVDALQPSSGELVLVDTNRDDIYDTVFVKEYEYYIVDYVDPVVHTIFAKNQTLSGYDSIELDPDRYREYKFNIQNVDGEPMELEDINEWDVLAVAADRPNASGVGTNRAELINIIVLNDTVEGEVTEYSEEYQEYSINGQRYEINASAYLPGVELGSEGVFFLDLDGRIVYADTSMKVSRNYAFLIETGLETVFGSSTAQFRILTADGDVAIYSGANTIRYTNSQGTEVTYRQSASAGQKSHADLVGDPNKDISADLQPGQLITMRLNSAGEITRIASARSNGTDAAFSIYDWGEMNYKNGYMGRRYVVDENTIVFEIPENESDYEKYSVKDGSIFTDGANYNVDLYDVADDGRVAVMVLKEKDPSYGA
ncbi:MAG TPA: S-layer homology domain-containing protein, partial [Gallicola sp.]|nr:S-layer homology domain-containing protein [Gallicola sp.]